MFKNKTSTKKILIIGGGFAGLNVAKSLSKSHHDVLLIDKLNHHLFTPLLYQVASAVLTPTDIAYPFRDIFPQEKNIKVLMGEVIGIDCSGKQVTLFNGETYSFDTLVVACGTSPFYFSHREWEKWAPSLKNLRHALKLREKTLLSFEYADRLGNEKKAQPYLNFVIIGGGPTGVELAGALSEIAYRTMIKDFRHLNSQQAKIYLIEGAKQLLPTYSKILSRKAEKDLREMGVKIILGKKVEKITAEGVIVGEETIPSKNIIWAAGNRPPEILKTLGEIDPASGRVKVGTDLSLPQHRDIFVIGDAAYALKGNIPLPGIAPVAIQQGKYVAKVILEQMPASQRPPFHYTDRGQLATIGKSRAVGTLWGLKLVGPIAFFLWSVVHIFYLIGFKNKLMVMMEWIFHYMTEMRGSRLIYRSLNSLYEKESLDELFHPESTEKK